MNRINAVAPAERNKRPIFEHLTPLLLDARHVLEIGAGDGTHARHARNCLPDIRWQTTEHPDRMALLRQGLADSRELPVPQELDVTQNGQWPRTGQDAVYAANVTHIMHWPAVEALFAGAAGVLKPGGMLCLYGPFVDAGVATADSNRDFDRSLRQRDAGMGLRRIQALHELAAHHGLVASHDWPMPANNRLLVWRRSASAAG